MPSLCRNWARPVKRAASMYLKCRHHQCTVSPDSYSIGAVIRRMMTYDEIFRVVSSLPVGSCSRWYFGAVWRWWYLYIIVLGYSRTIRYYPPSLARQLDPLRLFVFRDTTVTTCFVEDATTERVTSDAPDVHNFAPASSGGIAGITPVLQDLWHHQLNQN